MEDVRTAIVEEDSRHNFLNDPYELSTTGSKNGSNRSSGTGNVLLNGLGGSKKHNTRRSMDNLLKVDTGYGRRFQVGYFLLQLHTKFRSFLLSEIMCQSIIRNSEF